MRAVGSIAQGKWITAFEAMAAALLMLTAPCAASDDRVPFTKAEGEITLDGRLDEASWQTAPALTRFFEIDPANLGVPSVATTASFLYDERNVYVGVRASDPNPASIRAPIVRRDQVLADQDYVEVLLDPLNTRRSALFFRVNARGIVTDGQYDDGTRIRDYSPDLNFDVATSMDAEGWTAEFRIPLASLRYRPGIDNPWAYAVYRNVPREHVVILSSAPMPRGENCILCYVHVLSGIAVANGDSALSLIPHITYVRLDDHAGTGNDLDAGIDLTWKPRENTVIDATVFPDFSQIEADAPQLTGNTQFALALTEKRPFFLEGTDLLTTQVPAIYTRAFTDPDAGVRITDRSSRYEYTALALRDAGGGTVIEPGPIRSRAGLQDFESTALVARNRYLLDDTSLGMLATARFNDDGSQNVVIGADTTWSPSTSDQITAQFLRSETRNPNRPDLLDVWTGQRLAGDASSVMWTHNANAWYGNVSYQSYSRGFRAWNGFVTQVGVSSLSAVGMLYFYPSKGPITRVVPNLTLTRVDSSGGTTIGQAVSPGIFIRAARDTTVSLTWQPHATSTTLAGPRSYNSFIFSAVSTPFAWIPQASLLLTGGEMVDAVTGEIGDGLSAELSLPLRFSRLEINPAVGYQTLESKAAAGDENTLFTERNLQLSATWHFSSRLNLRVTQQEAAFDAAPPFAGLELRTRATSRLSSLLLSYQTNWQTRYYIGALKASNEVDGLEDPRARRTELFAKISYAFSR